MFFADPETEYPCSNFDKCKGFTKLMCLVMSLKDFPDFISLIKQYIKDNPNSIHEKNQLGWTALCLAVRNCTTYSSEEAVKLLIEAGSDINHLTHYRNSIVQLSSFTRYGASEKVLKLLIRAGTDINICDDTAVSPIHVACHSGTSKTIKRLFKYGSKINHKNYLGNTSMHNILSKLLTEKDLDGILKLEENLECCLKLGADTNIKNKNGTTILHESIKLKNEKLINLILDYHPDLNIQDNDGNTPLHLAIKASFCSVVERLVLEGADFYIKNQLQFNPLVLTYGDCTKIIITNHVKYKEKEYLKKINYQRIIKDIPQQSASIMLKANNPGKFNRLGSTIILCQLKLQNESLYDVYNFVKESCPNVLDYLCINNVEDFSSKINSYNSQF